MPARCATRAETIAKALGEREVGGGWMARCPAHEDRNPSLSIHDADDGKVLARCHAGSDQARVMEALRTRALWSNRPQDPLHAIRATRNQARTDVPDRDDDKRTEAPMRNRREARRLTGTLVEVYLRTRGITLSVRVDLRFRAALKPPSGINLAGDGRAAGARGQRDAVAVHRTFLRGTASEGADRSAEDDARSLSGRARTAGARGGAADGRRRH
jgi:putative DNA primase/helicase